MADVKIHEAIDEEPFGGKGLLPVTLVELEENLKLAREWLSKKVKE